MNLGDTEQIPCYLIVFPVFALTVFGREGLDEISISGETLVGELCNGEVHEYVVHPD